jgi:uncharacterized protein (DUF1684 family)
MKRIYLVIITIALSSAAFAQNAYKDSMADYQHNYKKELYSIIKNDTSFVQFYAVDHSYKVVGTAERLQQQPFFAMATSGKSPQRAIRAVLVHFTLHGQSYQLYGYQLSFLMNSQDHKQAFFIPFTDATSGLTSYGGGRYLDFELSDIQSNNTLVIDFNKAYNPYCAFVSGYNCPIPPKENDLSAAIKAGEMNFGKHK